jgi:hypothetical protein
MHRTPRHKTTDLTISLQTLREQIHTIRGQKVIIDTDLASLYGVTTRRLNEQLRRNKSRFLQEVAFRLSPVEFSNLKSHIATSSSGWGGRRKLPYAFTEHGVLMAANILNGALAVQASIHVIRAFIALRESLSIYKELSEKFEELQKQYQNHDETIGEIFEAIRKWTGPALVHPSRQIGFTSKESGKPRLARKTGSAVGRLTLPLEPARPAPSRSRRRLRQ